MVPDALDWLRIESWVVLALWVFASWSTLRHLPSANGERPFIMAVFAIGVLGFAGALALAYNAQRAISLSSHQDSVVMAFVGRTTLGMKALAVAWLGEVLKNPESIWWKVARR